MTTFTQRSVAAALLVAINLSMPAGARCQSGRPDGRAGKTLVAVAGGMFVDTNGDDKAPFAGLRFGRLLGRFVVAEVSASYAATATPVFSPRGPIWRVHTPIVTGDVGMQLQLPLGIFAPYLGGTIGAFRRQGTGAIASDAGWLLAATGGGRIQLGHRYFVQGEMKLRRDVYDFGRAMDAQFTFGLGGRF